MNDFQIGDLVRNKQAPGTIGRIASYCAWADADDEATVRATPSSDLEHIVNPKNLHKIAPLTIEDLRSHDFSQGNLHLWRASTYGLTELSVHTWKLEQSASVQQLSLCEHRATHVFSPNLSGIRTLYLDKDDAIVASAWMLREQQADRRKQIAELEQQEQEMLAGLGL